MEAARDVLSTRIAERFAPAPMTPARRAAFDASLRRRLERRAAARPRLVLAVRPAAAVAALAALWVGSAPPRTDPGEAGGAGSPPPLTTRVWEEEILRAESDLDEESGDADEVLPADYAAIESLLLGS
jgi:hypothetical protein